MEDFRQKIKEFDHGREVARRDKQIYGRPFEPYLSRESNFCRGYRYEWKTQKNI